MTSINYNFSPRSMTHIPLLAPEHNIDLVINTCMLDRLVAQDNYRFKGEFIPLCPTILCRMALLDAAANAQGRANIVGIGRRYVTTYTNGSVTAYYLRFQRGNLLAARDGKLTYGIDIDCDEKL